MTPILILGAGTIGTGLAANALAKDLDVVLMDSNPKTLRTAQTRIKHSLRTARLMGWSQPTNTTTTMLSKLTTTQDIKSIPQANFIVECIYEDLHAKHKLLTNLDNTHPQAQLSATTTSAIPIHILAQATQQPDRLLAIHLMNPVIAKNTVELIPSRHTSPQALEQAHILLHALGKQPLTVKDGPGFVINRILMLTINEAIATLADEQTDAATLDALMTNCLGHTMGPLATADLIGLDVILHTLEVLTTHHSAKYQPHPLLQDMVSQGLLGRKSGQGFFLYRSPS